MRCCKLGDSGRITSHVHAFCGTPLSALANRGTCAPPQSHPLTTARLALYIQYPEDSKNIITGRSIHILQLYQYMLIFLLLSLFFQSYYIRVSSLGGKWLPHLRGIQVCDRWYGIARRRKEPPSTSAATAASFFIGHLNFRHHNHVCVIGTRVQRGQRVCLSLLQRPTFDIRLTGYRRYDTCFLKWYSESEPPHPPGGPVLTVPLLTRRRVPQRRREGQPGVRHAL